MTRKNDLRIKVLCIFLLIGIMTVSMCGCGHSPEETYALIKEELKTTQALEADYFAQYYDMNELNSIKSDTEKALEDSNEEVYEDVLAELKTQNEAMSAFIESERDKLYNVQTIKEIDSEYPFSMYIDELPTNWFAEPLVKQTSSHPLRVDMSEPDYTDESPYASLWINSSSHKYNYDIKEIDTKEIKVKNENGEIVKALVNTEIQFRQQNRHPVNMTEETVLNERPGYIMENKDGMTILALQNYDGEDYYVLYACYVGQ